MKFTAETVEAEFTRQGLSEALSIYHAGPTYQYPDHRIGEIVGWCLFSGYMSHKQKGLLRAMLEERRTGKSNAAHQ